jgi:hypothetical protein
MIPFVPLDGCKVGYLRAGPTLPLIGHYRFLRLLDLHFQFIQSLFHPSGRLPGGVIFGAEVIFNLVLDQRVGD